MLSHRRLPLLVAFPAFYVGIAALRAGEARPSAWLLIVIAVIVGLVGGRVDAATDVGERGIGEGGTARRRRLTATGLSVCIATAALSTRPAWAAIARELGACVAMLAAPWSVAMIEGDVGLAARASEASVPAKLGPRAIARAATAVLVVAWGSAILVDALAWSRVTPTSVGPVLAASAAAVALFTISGAALLIARVRHLELGVGPRALACAGAAGAGLLAATWLATEGSLPPDGSLALCGTLAAAMIVRLARARDPLTLARRGRRALTLVLFGGPIAGLAAITLDGRVAGSWSVALALAAATLLVGALASKLEEPFLPVKGVLLDALADARDAAGEREARSAMAHAMVRLREASAVGLGEAASPSPELWLLHPTRVLTVNAAGYLQERNAELPDNVFDVTLGEPHGTLRTSVLRALQVRRADLRPLLAWLEHRDALFATVIAESDDPDGLIIVPAGARTEEPTLEEIKAAKRLADAFVAVSQATSAKVRHLERERVLKERIDVLDDEMARVRHAADLDVGRNVLASMRLARPATVGIYSAVSRLAYEALERRIAQDSPTVVVARAGIDPVPYIARAHLSGPRKNGPLVVVDSTSSREHDVERWRDERTSPLALADRGLLFLVDGAALPRDVQVLVARAALERRPPWERATPLDVTVALSGTLDVRGQGRGVVRAGFGAAIEVEAFLTDLVESGRLAPELAARFEATEAIVLPGLSERSEDLRSIVADRLAREGLRVHGRPVGIDAGAFARLVEYPFDGEDAELASIVTKLVRSVVASGGEVVRTSDVEALGLDRADGTETDESRPSVVRNPG
jgi:hypothetical protein